MAGDFPWQLISESWKCGLRHEVRVLVLGHMMPRPNKDVSPLSCPIQSVKSGHWQIEVVDVRMLLEYAFLFASILDHRAASSHEFLEVVQIIPLCLSHQRSEPLLLFPGPNPRAPAFRTSPARTVTSGPLFKKGPKRSSSCGRGPLRDTRASRTRSPYDSSLVQDTTHQGTRSTA